MQALGACYSLVACKALVWACKATAADCRLIGGVYGPGLGVEGHNYLFLLLARRHCRPRPCSEKLT